MEKVHVVATHAGQYHIDELLAINFLKEFTNWDIEIIRLSNPEQIPRDAIAIDFGFGELDHHQEENVPCYIDGTKYCAANLVVAKYGLNYMMESGLSKEYAELAINQLQDDLKPIALTDNYGSVKYANTLSSWVACLNGIYNFNEAMAIIQPFVISKLIKIKESFGVIAKNNLLALRDPIVVTDDKIPMQYYNKEVKFIVGYGGREKYNVVSTNAQDHPVVATIGEKGCSFVHSERFLAAFDTLEQAKYCAAVSFIASQQI